MEKAHCVNPLGGLLDEGLNPMDGIHSQYWWGFWAEGASLSGNARRDRIAMLNASKGTR